MRLLLFYSSLLYHLFLALPTEATTVSVAASQAVVTHLQGDANSPAVTILLENTSADQTPAVFVWQLGLQIIPTVEAVGTIGFAAATEPSDSLFAGTSPPLAFPPLPQTPSPNTIDVSAANILAPTGVPLRAGEPKNVVDLLFDVSSDAAGAFQLVLAPFGTQPVGTSSWASQLIFNPMDAMPFENGAMGSSVGSRVLATIEVLPVPEPATIWSSSVAISLLAARRGRRPFDQWQGGVNQ
ncbi:MAG: hypothetical protein AAGD11_07665 [Planctomycetota bacterium]